MRLQIVKGKIIIIIILVTLVDDIVAIRYVLPTWLQIVKGEINFFC